MSYGILKTLEVEITPDTSIYAAGDVIGGLLEVGPLETPSGGMVINGLSLVDEDNEGAGLTLHIFDRKPTEIDDQDAFTPSYVDLIKRVGLVQIASGDYETINSLKIASKDVGNVFVGNPTIWLYLVCMGAPTFAVDKKLFLRIFAMG